MIPLVVSVLSLIGSGGPVVTASQTTNLKSVHEITVSISGYPANENVNVAVCSQTQTATHCDFDNFVALVSDRNGKASGVLRVRSSFIGSDPYGREAARQVQCRTEDRGCFIIAAHKTSAGQPGVAMGSPLFFA